MSARSAIPKAMVEKIAALFTGSGNYVNNIYSNVDTKVVHFENVVDFPYISVTPGAETREDLPSNMSWGYLNVNITIYVQSPDSAQEMLESLISDVETFLDTNLRLQYTVVTPAGEQTLTTVTNTIVSIDTDEGILNPLALGQVVVTVQYEKVRPTI